MDTHIDGPRGRRTKGAIVSQIICGAKFGDSALVAQEVFRTRGAASGLGFIQTTDAIASLGAGGAGSDKSSPTTRKFPLFLRVCGHLLTAFDGTAPLLALTETNLDGSGVVTIADLADFTGVAARPASVTDGASTTSSPTITSATANFTDEDVGDPISGTGIPANSYIGIVNSSTSIGLSSSPTANVPVNFNTTGTTGITLTFGGRLVLFGPFFKVLTVDKIYKLTYTPATGSPTVGEAYFVIEITGPGLSLLSLQALTGPTVQP